MKETTGSPSFVALLAAALWGGCIAGVLGMVVSGLALLNGNLLAAAIAAVGAGLSFGLVGNALLRE